MNKMMKWSIALVVLALAGAGIYQASTPSLTASTPDHYKMVDKDGQALPDYVVPDDLEIANEANADEIMFGKLLLNETKRMLPNNVGAQMNCNSCHIAEGKSQYGAPYLTSLPQYPKVMPRAGKMVDMPMRINGCFQRSMNGKPLPVDSKEMKAMLAYMAWLSKTQPEGAKVTLVNSGPVNESLVPNAERGKVIYAAMCATCHGDNGEGMKDKRGHVVFPPLWGDESFNIGAGLARTYKAAQFVKYNMPMGVQTHGAWGQGGVLDDQAAIDVAEYFTHMPRPDFAGTAKDWPNGKKPKDARY